ncbi:sigma-70 family RNA polymerase sigma factor, partial [Candidatus Poribacteria bacterium]|nr:sigma-70 family RNA polymerase sigma factor [Candidatus Poribacteria bacterium]
MRDAERTAFETELLSHVGLIRHIGQSRLDERGVLDDFTQEVLTSACAYRERHGDPDTLSRWLATVARNMATDWNRKQRPTPVATLPEMTTAYTPARAAEASERWTALFDALDALDPTDRDIVYGRYFQDESYRALGKRHGLSAEAVGFRLHRSRGRLRSRLEGVLAGAGLAWGIRARGAAYGAMAMKMGHGSASAIAFAVACLVALAVGVVVMVMNNTGAAAETQPATTPSAQRSASPARASGRVGEPVAEGRNPTGSQAAEEDRSSRETASAGAAPARVVQPDTPAPEATPRAQAEAALDGFVGALQQYDPLVEPDALVDRSSGQARQVFEQLRDWFLSDERPASYDAELAELRGVELVGQTFGDGEMRASIVNPETTNPENPPSEMI